EGCPEFMPRHSVIPLHAPSPEILAHGPPLANVNSALSQAIQPACPRLPLALHGARHGRCQGKVSLVCHGWKAPPADGRVRVGPKDGRFQAKPKAERILVVELSS